MTLPLRTTASFAAFVFCSAVAPASTSARSAKALQAISCDGQYERKETGKPDVQSSMRRTYVLDDQHGQIFRFDPDANSLVAVCDRALSKCELNYGASKITVSRLDDGINADTTSLDRRSGEIATWYWRNDLANRYDLSITFKGNCSSAPMPSLKALKRKF